MASTINALTSGGGLAVSGDTSGSLQLQTNNGTTAMTIDTSQNVGIGVTSPAYPLEIQSGTDSRLRFENNGVLNSSLITSTNNARNAYQPLITGGSYVATYTGGSERNRTDSAGSFLIGATTTGVSGYSVGKTIIQNNDYSGSVAYSLNSTSTTGTQYFLVFGRGGSACGLISSGGTNSTTYATSSDYRLKENVAPMQNALGVVAQLKPVTYTWKADGSDGQGFIAHELQEVVPNAVVGQKDATRIVDELDAEGKVIGQKEEPVYQGIDTSFLVATLTAAIQELNAKVTALESQLGAKA